MPMSEDRQYVFRLTMEAGDLVNVELQGDDAEFYQPPGFFFVADMLRAASDAVLELINLEIEAEVMGEVY